MAMSASRSLSFALSPRSTAGEVAHPAVFSGGAARWTAPYTDFLGIVLSVEHGEIERDNKQKIELRHLDNNRSMLLHRSKGSGLHPDFRQHVTEIAARLGLRPFVETDGALVPLTE
jgi:hypothetical protein